MKLADSSAALYLEVTEHGAVQQNLPLRANSKTLVGRLPECNIQVDHPTVSRQHAVLLHQRAGTQELLVIVDLGSTSGT